MKKRIGLWRLLVPPAVVPLGLTLFVAMAGPGGVVDIGDDAGPTAGSEDGCSLTVLEDAVQSYPVLDEHVSDPEMPRAA